MAKSDNSFHIKRDQLSLAIDDFFSKGGRIKNINLSKSIKDTGITADFDDDAYYLDNPYIEVSPFESMPKLQRFDEFD